jgi:hypothetical protein
MDREVLSVRKYKAGYEVRTERVFHNGGDEFTIMKSAYNPSGDYIGNSVDGHRLVVRRGIAPEKRTSNSNVCSIGFCEKEQKWYGWSHRAIFGFGIGDIVKEGDCTASSGWTDEYLEECPEADVSLPVGFEAKTLEDAKRMAIAFADSVG